MHSGLAVARPLLQQRRPSLDEVVVGVGGEEKEKVPKVEQYFLQSRHSLHQTLHQSSHPQHQSQQQHQQNYHFQQQQQQQPQPQPQPHPPLLLAQTSGQQQQLGRLEALAIQCKRLADESQDARLTPTAFASGSLLSASSSSSSSSTSTSSSLCSAQLFRQTNCASLTAAHQNLQYQQHLHNDEHRRGIQRQLSAGDALRPSLVSQRWQPQTQPQPPPQMYNADGQHCDFSADFGATFSNLHRPPIAAATQSLQLHQTASLPRSLDFQLHPQPVNCQPTQRNQFVTSLPAPQASVGASGSLRRTIAGSGANNQAPIRSQLSRHQSADQSLKPLVKAFNVPGKQQTVGDLHANSASAPFFQQPPPPPSQIMSRQQQQHHHNHSQHHHHQHQHQQLKHQHSQPNSAPAPLTNSTTTAAAPQVAGATTQGVQMPTTASSVVNSVPNLTAAGAGQPVAASFAPVSARNRSHLQIPPLDGSIHLPLPTSHRTNSPWMRISCIILTPVGILFIFVIVISPLLHYLM